MNLELFLEATLFVAVALTVLIILSGRFLTIRFFQWLKEKKAKKQA